MIRFNFYLFITIIFTSSNSYSIDSKNLLNKEIISSTNDEINDFDKGLRFLNDNPKISNNYLNINELGSLTEIRVDYQNCKKNNLTENCEEIYRTIELTKSNTDESKYPTIPLFNLISEIGHNLRAFDNNESMAEFYEQSRKELKVKLNLIENSKSAIHLQLNRDIYPKYLSLAKKRAKLLSESKIPINKCSSALGYSYKNRVTNDGSSWCKESKFSNKGLLKTMDFTLKKSLTCVKNQSRRGTCTAFAMAGAIETEVKHKSKKEINLSEQTLYFYNEIYGNFFGRYTYGVNTTRALRKLKNKRARIPLESNWVYNRSAHMYSFDPEEKIYPNSCEDYSGKICTNYSFQAIEKKKNIGKYEYKVPPINTQSYLIKSRKSFFNFFNKKGSLHQAIYYLSLGKPVISSFTVTSEFRSFGRGTNYIKYFDEEKGGGHATVLVGFIFNENLPPGIEKASEEGYFIMKNSWGKNWGDCGHVYVDFKYLRKYGYALSTITIEENDT